jgi:hypothetical protein
MLSDALVEVAMSYVRTTAPDLSDESALQQIRDAFTGLISGSGPADPVVTLLDHHINNRQPLERILSILQTPEDPPPDTWRESSPEQHTSARRRPRPWSPAEDTRLLAAIHRFGLENWGYVASFVGNVRTRAQCAQRWLRVLDPRISKEQWSHIDETRLIQLVRDEGTTGWTKIALGLRNRSDVQCRYHFFQMRREGRLPPDLVRSLQADHHVSNAIPLPPSQPTNFVGFVVIPIVRYR